MEEAARRMPDLRVFKGRFPPRRRDHPPAAAIVRLGFAIGDARSEMDRPPAPEHDGPFPIISMDVPRNSVSMSKA
jgi:hypothetical protein